ncbi:MAG: hypothetical protein HJJLKODD_02477 [Phycisphaerae bacterium]|nr:hypothetical protein [Phycisphaerae bacterium]
MYSTPPNVLRSSAFSLVELIIVIVIIGIISAIAIPKLSNANSNALRDQTCQNAVTIQKALDGLLLEYPDLPAIDQDLSENLVHYLVLPLDSHYCAIPEAPLGSYLPYIPQNPLVSQAPSALTQFSYDAPGTTCSNDPYPYTVRMALGNGFSASPINEDTDYGWYLNNQTGDYRIGYYLGLDKAAVFP